MFRLITFSFVYLGAVLLVILGVILCVKLFYTGQYEAYICATLALDWVFVSIGYVIWLFRRDVI